MEKKTIVFIIAIAARCVALFAQEEMEKPKIAFGISAGIGGFIGGDFGGGAEGRATKDKQSMSMKIETPYFGGGGYVFFDAVYAELSFGIYGGGGKSKTTLKATAEGIDVGQTVESDRSTVNFNIGLTGKYPFAINQKVSVFPLFGIEYDVCLSAKDEDGNEYENSDGDKAPGDFSALWFKFGGGLDFSFAEKNYLRFEALYGLRTANKAENDMEDMIVAILRTATGIEAGRKRLPGHGLTVKLAVGHKF
jgi:hypothetical protein